MYFLTLFVLIAALVWPLVVLAPDRRVARAAARTAARSLLRASGIRVDVRGTDRLHDLESPCVLVANHASEIDSIALLASLPLSFSFVAKIELARTVIVRWPLRRLGTLFVRRGGPPATPSQTQLAVERLRAGDDLLFFPEGTFRRELGLLRFHRGAFVAAALARVPVIPIALSGTREMTPGDRKLPQRGSIRIEIGSPLRPLPDVDPAVAALVLRHRARAFILAHTGEIRREWPKRQKRAAARIPTHRQR